MTLLGILIIGALGALTVPQPEIDPHLENLSREYYSRTPVVTSTKVVRLVFSDMKVENAIMFTKLYGLCYPLTSSLWNGEWQMAVHINEELRYKPLLLEQVLWHELGHCVHKKWHTYENEIMAESASNPVNQAHLDSQKRHYINYLQNKNKKK